MMENNNESIRSNVFVSEFIPCNSFIWKGCGVSYRDFLRSMLCLVFMEGQMTITLTREEAQQVLDALDGHSVYKVEAAIEFFRVRLSAPEPEPVAWRIRCTDPLRPWVLMYRYPETEKQFSNMEMQPLYTKPHSAAHSADSAESFCKPEKNEHEPVAFVCFKRGEVDYESDVVISNTAGDCMDDSTEWRPVYTATPQRECKCKHCGGINDC